MCLGDWESPRGDRYIALMDLREEPEARPKYRCGVSKDSLFALLTDSQSVREKECVHFPSDTNTHTKQHSSLT